LSKFISQYDVNTKELLSCLNAEIGLTFAWLEDTLYPSINLMRLKSLIYDIQTDVKLFEDKNGKSEHTKKSLDRANELIDLADKLDKIANQNNTAQLLLRHNHLKMAELINENKRLKTELEATKKAWNNL
jgi:predicted  nucleic acid-binding Zn-ribbon protein